MKARQPELGFTDEPFCLVKETTLDGQRLAEQSARRAQAQAEADARQLRNPDWQIHAQAPARAD